MSVLWVTQASHQPLLMSNDKTVDTGNGGDICFLAFKNALRYVLFERERWSVGPVCIWSLNTTIGERRVCPPCILLFPQKEILMTIISIFAHQATKRLAEISRSVLILRFCLKKTVYRPRPSIVLS